MADELLPPDPSKDARYWLTSPDKAQVIGMWRARSHRWIAEDWIRPGTPRDFGSVGYRLASPHPIPGPEQLEELYRDAATTAAFRAALGAKPDDPPGNGLDDTRAAAMDQWDVPRAGEETAP